MRITSAHLPAAILLGWIFSACAGPQAIGGGGPAATAPPPSPGTAPPVREAVPDGLLQSLCDRWEDCVVEQNEALARALGGTPLDLDAARDEARAAVLVGAARRWCQLRLGASDPATLRARQSCLGLKECGALSRCLMGPTPVPAARSTPR